MARPFRDLPRVMNKTADKLVRGVTRVARKATLAIQNAVVEDTPVDTGAARSNWVASVDRPFLGFIPAYAPGRKLGRGESANKASANAQAASAVASFDARRNRSLFIANSTPYMHLLNAAPPGSRQSPSFFVQAAVARGVASVRGVRLLT